MAAEGAKGRVWRMPGTLTGGVELWQRKEKKAVHSRLCPGVHFLGRGSPPGGDVYQGSPAHAGRGTLWRWLLKYGDDLITESQPSTNLAVCKKFIKYVMIAKKAKQRHRHEVQRAILEKVTKKCK